MRKHLLLFRSLSLGSIIISNTLACQHHENDNHDNHDNHDSNDKVTTTDKANEPKSDEATTTDTDKANEPKSDEAATTDKTSNTEPKNDETTTSTKNTEENKIINLEPITLNWVTDLTGDKLSTDSLENVINMIKKNISQKLQITSENYELINLNKKLKEKNFVLNEPYNFLFTIKIKDNNSDKFKIGEVIIITKMKHQDK